MPTTRLYTGQRLGSALALYDYRARYYHPALGRFISADPVVPEPGNPQAVRDKVRRTGDAERRPFCVSVR